MPKKQTRAKKMKVKVIKRVKRFSVLQLVIFAAIFAGVGGYAIYRSFAITDVTHIGAYYVNPLRDVTNVSASRIDQGVDYNGNGNVVALGDGVMTTINTSNSSWLNHFYAYRLTNGPAAGLYVYVAEHCRYFNPNLSVGSHVSVGQRLCQMYSGSTNGESGIEMGWADRANNAPAAAGGCAYGKNFSKLMAAFRADLAGRVDGTFPCGSGTAPNPPYRNWAY